MKLEAQKNANAFLRPAVVLAPRPKLTWDMSVLSVLTRKNALLETGLDKRVSVGCLRNLAVEPARGSSAKGGCTMGSCSFKR